MTGTHQPAKSGLTSALPRLGKGPFHEGAASLRAGRAGFSAVARERRGENRIGGRAFASMPCQRFHHATNHSFGRGVADNCHRDCLALYFGSLRWDRRKRSSPAPGSLPGPTPALRTSSTERPLLQRAKSSTLGFSAIGHGCMENNTRASVLLLISAITQP